MTLSSNPRRPTTAAKHPGLDDSQAQAADNAPSKAWRGFALLFALVGWAALALQLALSIGLARSNGQSAGWGVFMYLGYFTILTNVLVALALSAAALSGRSAFWRFFRDPGVASAIGANITVVGAVYFLVLRHVWAPQGLLLLCDVLLHYVMPLAYLVFWWFAVPARGLGFARVLRWWAYPLGYLVYALVRGEVAGVYPYPFVDVGALGYARTALNAVGVLAGFTGVAVLLLALARLQPGPKKV